MYKKALAQINAVACCITLLTHPSSTWLLLLRPPQDIFTASSHMDNHLPLLRRTACNATEF